MSNSENNDNYELSPSRTFIYIAVIMIILFIAGLIGLVFVVTSSSCGSTFECRDREVQQCLSTENYTRDECVQLVIPNH